MRSNPRQSQPDRPLLNALPCRRARRYRDPIAQLILNHCLGQSPEARNNEDGAVKRQATVQNVGPDVIPVVISQEASLNVQNFKNRDMTRSQRLCSGAEHSHTSATRLWKLSILLIRLLNWPTHRSNN